MAHQELRMRVFAGPNGSGKSTVINNVRNQRVGKKIIDFGIYINADDIAHALDTKYVSFDDYSITATKKEFQNIAFESGLLADSITKKQFEKSFTLYKNCIRLKHKAIKDKLAQIIADFIRKQLLKERKKFSFETVFSHRSKLEVMQQAVDLGYKVYLYFVSTESEEINVYRVKARKQKGGHDVPESKIRSRYKRSLEMLYDASQLAYQAFYFDNSEDGRDAAMFAHFKKVGNEKKWDEINEKDVPFWFRKYYSSKIP